MSMDYTLALSEAEQRRFRIMAAEALQSEQEDWKASGIVPGARVVDIGCGPAAILIELARLVEPSGWADGVETDAQARAWATQAISAAGITNARIVAGEAEATGLEPRSYNVVMMRHVLLHNGPRVHEIIAHLATLLQPGGHLYLVETDPTSIHAVPQHAELQDLGERALQLMRLKGNDLHVGIKLGHLLLNAGLELVKFDAKFIVSSGKAAARIEPPSWAAREAIVHAGLATEMDIQRWQTAIDQQAGDPTPRFIFVPMFRAIGRLPTR